MKDEKIIRELESGNTRVLAELYRHFPKIVKLVTENSGSKEDAKDLFQDALLIFYKNVRDGKFRLQSQIGTYLYGICRNNMLNNLRKNKFTVRRTENTPEPYEIGVFGEEPAVSVREAVDNLLGRAGEPCRSLLVSFHFKQMNWEQIAGNLGYANAKTARQQKYKCVLKLKKLIPQHLKESLLNAIA